MHFESAAKNRAPSAPGSQDATKPPLALKNAQSRSTSSQEINDRLAHDMPPNVRRPVDASLLTQGLTQPGVVGAAAALGRVANSQQCFLDELGLGREKEAFRTFGMEMPQHVQGAENSCGTTSLAMSMAYLGVPADFRIIDRSLRMFDPDAGAGTAPGDMVEFARRSGLQAEQYNDGSLEQLVSHVRGGRPVTVLLNYEYATSGMAHYLNVIGFERDTAGEIEDVVMLNPWGQVDRLSLKDFMAQWSNVSVAREGVMAALPTFNRLMVVLDRPENPPLPKPNMSAALKASTTNTMMNGVSGLSAGIETKKRGEAVAGGAQLVGASINTIVGGTSYIIGNIVGQNIERGGELLLDAGNEMLQGNLAEKVGGFFSLIFGGVLKGLGTLLGWMGGALAGLSRFIAKPLNSAGEEASRRHETREMLLNENRWGGVEHPAYVLSRASTETKRRMLENLLDGSGTVSLKDQQAAMVILRSAEGDERELALLAESFGGAQEFQKHFSKERVFEFASMYQLDTSSTTSSDELVAVG